MNIDITPGLADQYGTSGLCGNYDGDITNDGEVKDHDVVTNYKVLVETSLQEHRYLSVFTNQYALNRRTQAE